MPAVAAPHVRAPRCAGFRFPRVSVR